MNRFLLVLGSLMLLALTAALIAPRFIDWSDYTDVIEEQASRLLGREVHVSGDVDLRFLPMPRITFSDIEIAQDASGGQPGFKARRVEALMSLAPFLSGDTHIVELTLEEPVIRLAALGGGRAQDVNQTLDLGRVSIDEATIVGGRVERLAADGTIQTLIEDLNANMSAPSLLGPWRVDPASAIMAGERVTLRVNTGGYDGNRRMRMRVTALPVERPMELAVDGHLDWAAEGARFEGRGVARSLEAMVQDDAAMALTWRVSADIDASLDALEAEDIALTLGQAQDQAFVLNGRAHVDLGERPAFNAQMSARQVDLDRMLGGGAANPIDTQAGWAAAGSLLRWIDRFTVPGDMAFDIPAIVLGGSVIRDIGFDATYRPGLPVSLDGLVATFPGETQLNFTGAVGAVGALEGTDLAVDGLVHLQSAAPDVFVGWSTGRRDEGGTFSQLSSIDLRGRIAAQPGDIAIEGLLGDIDGAQLDGALVFRDIAGLGEQMDIRLNAGRFDFALLSGLGRWLTDVGAADSDDGPFVDTLNAKLSISELVAGAEDLGEVQVEVAATPELVRIDRLTIGDAAGAAVTAFGTLDRGSFPPTGSITLDADVERLGGIARLARDIIGDHPLVMDLVRNANLYQPASLAGSYRHEPATGLEVDLSGSVGGTGVTLFGSIPPTETASLPSGLGSLFDRSVELRFEAQSQDAFVLVGQLGVAALPIELQGPGTLFANLVTEAGSAPQVRLAFDGLDGTVRLNGVLEGDSHEGITGFVGDGSFFAGDVAQIGLMAGMALPGLFDPISASAGFDVSYDVATQTAQFDLLDGAFADVPLAGGGSIERGALGTLLSLDITADRVDLPILLAGFLGPGTFDQGFSPTWPEGVIAFNPLPIDLELEIAAPRMRLWEGLDSQNGQLSLLAQDGRVTLDTLRANTLGGTVAGRAVLRDSQPGAIIEGRLSLSDIDAGQLSWERSGGPVVTGAFSANLSFETAGGSITSLMSGLTGEGTLALSNAEISGLGLSGFARILQASDAGLLDEPEDLESAFLDALSVGTMSIENADTPITVVGGVVTANNMYVEGFNTALRGGAIFDLAAQTLDADFSFAVIEGPGDVEAMPNVALSFAGPVEAPARQLDVSQVASFLNVRQLELEIDRVEALNAEILERERLLRIMAAIDLDRERIAFEEAEAERLERERLEAEQLEQERIEAERRAAEEAELQIEAERRAEEAREQALREALLARERDQQRLNTRTPSTFELQFPGLFVTTPNEAPPPQQPSGSVTAPLDLSPQ